MSADILLSHGYFLAEDEKEQEIMRPYPPLGILYLSAYLKREGFAVELFDSTMRNRAQLNERFDQESGVVGLYTTLMTRGSVVRTMTDARARGWTVIVGGPDAANYAKEYLQHGAHVVVIGEGERTLAETITALASKGAHRLQGVAGTVFLDEDGVTITNPGRELIADIDQLPWPDRDAIDVQSYIDVWREHHGEGSVNLITARGCPYRCNWCSHAVYGHTHRRRSAENCAAEVEWIVNTYEPDQVWYADDVFTMNHKWLFQYQEELKRRKIQIPFETITRADRMMKPDVVRCLAELGCHRIWIGSESGSQRILDAMERGVTKEQVKWAVQEAQRNGIEVGMFLMWGYEGEEFEDVEQTVDFVSDVQPDIFFTTLAYPIMNTGYYEKVQDRVLIPAPWAQTSDREHGVAGRPGREHFQAADDWLKSSVKAARFQETEPETAKQHQEAAWAARQSFFEACRQWEARNS